jgi:hypothetical protein
VHSRVAGAFSRCPTFHLRRCVHSRLSFLFFFSSSQGLYFVTFLFVCAPPPASSVIGREENRVVSINNTKKSHLNEKSKTCWLHHPAYVNCIARCRVEGNETTLPYKSLLAVCPREEEAELLSSFGRLCANSWPVSNSPLQEEKVQLSGRKPRHLFNWRLPTIFAVHESLNRSLVWAFFLLIRMTHIPPFPPVISCACLSIRMDKMLMAG